MSDENQKLTLKLKLYCELLDVLLSDRNFDEISKKLDDLDKMPVNIFHFFSTNIGKKVNVIRKLKNNTGKKATLLIIKWRDSFMDVIEEQMDLVVSDIMKMTDEEVKQRKEQIRANIKPHVNTGEIISLTIPLRKEKAQMRVKELEEQIAALDKPTSSASTSHDNAGASGYNGAFSRAYGDDADAIDVHYAKKFKFIKI